MFILPLHINAHYFKESAAQIQRLPLTKCRTNKKITYKNMLPFFKFDVYVYGVPVLTFIIHIDLNFLNTTCVKYLHGNHVKYKGNHKVP